MKSFIPTNYKLFLGSAILGFLIAPSLFAQTVYFYDGDRKVEVTQAVGLLAEKTSLTGLNSPESSLVKKADSTAQVAKSVGNLRIWKTSAESTQASLSKIASKSIAEKNYLPVFKSVSGTLMVPVGNIIVYFQPDMTEEQVTKWAARRGLRPSKKLPLATKNVWEITTPAGLSAIEIANSAVGDSEVITASPNWWIEVSKR